MGAECDSFHPPVHAVHSFIIINIILSPLFSRSSLSLCVPVHYVLSLSLFFRGLQWRLHADFVFFSFLIQTKKPSYMTKKISSEDRTHDVRGFSDGVYGVRTPPRPAVHRRGSENVHRMRRTLTLTIPFASSSPAPLTAPPPPSRMCGGAIAPEIVQQQSGHQARGSVRIESSQRREMTLPLQPDGDGLDVLHRARARRRRHVGAHRHARLSRRHRAPQQGCPSPTKTPLNTFMQNVTFEFINIDRDHTYHNSNNVKV